MIPDPYKRTVCLPVRAVEGELKFFYGGDLPPMYDGAIGELTIPEFCLKKDYRLDLIRSETKKGNVKTQKKGKGRRYVVS